MRSPWILLPVMAFAGCTFAAPTPICGWKPPVPPLPGLPDPARINLRAAPAVGDTRINDPLDVVTRAAPPLSNVLSNPKRVDC